MRNLKLIVLGIIMFSSINSTAQTNPAIAPYTEYLNSQTNSAKEYILALFKTNDIVIICERDHREITQYDLFLDIVGDKRFVNIAGNVFTEIGLSNLNPSLNLFLQTKNLSIDEQKRQILNFQRNLSWNAMWEKYNYTYFLEGLYKINSRLSEQDAIRLYPSEVPFDWQKADSSTYKEIVMPLIENRDSIIASQIIQQISKIATQPAHHKKALVIMNFRHAFNRDFPLPGGRHISNVAAFLFKQYGKSVANVLLNPLKINLTGKQFLVQEGKWDAAFVAVKNNSLGFNFMGTPFGKDSFDLWPVGNPTFTYQDIFTGFAFYHPIEDQKLVTGIPGFLDSAYFDEFFRRMKLSAIILPNIKHFSQEEIASFKSNPQDLEKEINEKKEYQYQDIDSLLQIRRQWLK